MIVIIKLLLLLLATFANGDWTNPIHLESFREAQVWGVYRDPSLNITHALVSARLNRRYIYYALSNTGAILYRTYFDPGELGEPLAALRGDGQHLFVVLNKRSTVAFCESTDGGRMWSSFVDITSESSRPLLSDMVYVAETGQVSIFFNTRIGNTPTIRVVSRARESSSFSPEVTAGPGHLGPRSYASAGYGMYLSRCYMHIAYAHHNYSALLYTRSSDCGKSWSQPRTIVSSRVLHSNNVVTKENHVYIMYTEEVSDVKYLINMVYSSDYGMTFSSPIRVSRDPLIKSICQRVLALCKTASGEPANMMVSMIPTSKGIEYSAWDTTDMSYYYMPTSLNTGDEYASTGLDCVVDEVKSERHVTALKAGWTQSGNAKVYVAFETRWIPKAVLASNADE